MRALDWSWFAALFCATEFDLDLAAASRGLSEVRPQRGSARAVGDHRRLQLAYQNATSFSRIIGQVFET